ncbi:MAG TPA: hypothetical protein VNB94_04745 [Mycobacteriales bacterium]|nr:hypothetical protein [Mycobacteriales bacterium]
MKFIQVIEYQTSRFEEINALVEKHRANSDAGSGPIRGTVGLDRDRPNTYVSLIEFESYEKAMENSNKPETTELAKQMAELCDAPPKFYNLDVVVEG